MLIVDLHLAPSLVELIVTIHPDNMKRPFKKCLSVALWRSSEQGM